MVFLLKTHGRPNFSDVNFIQAHLPPGDQMVACSTASPAGPSTKHLSSARMAPLPTPLFVDHRHDLKSSYSAS